MAENQFRTRQYADLSVTNAKIAAGVDAAKISGGSVSNTEFDYLNGVTSAIQTQLNAKLGTTLNDANIFVGNGSNVATGVAMSGEASLANDGEITLDNDSVIAKVLNGFSSTTGTISASDSILSAIEKLNGNIAALSGGIIIKGSWDASSGVFPGSGSAKAGWQYIVDGPGTVDGVSFKDGDTVTALVDNASTTTYAGNWLIGDYTDEVLSVFGRTGAVSAVSGDYSADQIDSDAYSFITATDVQGALIELADAIDAIPAAASFAFNETPSGSINGSNTSFNLTNAPINSSLQLFLNGQALRAGSGNDYTISGTTITMATAPTAGETLVAGLYQY